MELNISAPSLEKLKCSMCQKHLSFFPIRVSGDKKNICGRCQVPDGTPLFHNKTFEKVCQFVKFPCEYHCDGQFYPSDIPTHEKICTKNAVPCPTKNNTDCLWEGQGSSILEHCLEQHSGAFLQNLTFTQNLNEKEEKNFLIQKDNLLLIFLVKISDCTVKFSLFTNECEQNKNTFLCELKVGELSFNFNSTSFENQSENVINLQSQKNKSVTFILDILPIESVDSEMLEVFKCFMCANFILPPVLECPNNSSLFCVDCKQDHQSHCAICATPAANIRNVALDKIGEKLLFPCRFPNCSFIGKPDQMKNHQMMCDFGQFKCPFPPCDWQGGYKAMETHIKTHQEFVPNNTEVVKQFVPGNMKIDIVKYGGKLFRLVSLYNGQENNGKYMWSVQMIGKYKEGFYYEIELSDLKNSGRKLLVRSQVEGFTVMDALFQENKYSYFWRKQVTEFCDLNSFQLNFKIRIFSD